MAIFVLTDCRIEVNGVVLSDRAKAVTVTDTRNKVDVTAFGATNTAYAKGLGDGSFQIEFYQDFAAAKTHATLQPLISSTTPVTVKVRPTSGAISATNPDITLASALLFDYSPIAGSIGDASTFPATFDNANPSGGITYVTA